MYMTFIPHVKRTKGAVFDIQYVHNFIHNCIMTSVKKGYVFGRIVCLSVKQDNLHNN